MARTFVRQETQIRNSDVYDDTLGAGFTLESGQATLEGDLNALRSQAKRFLWADNSGDWYADVNAPSTLDTGAKRGINNLNTDLHELERKRVLVSVTNLTDVTVGAGNNFVVLGGGQLPSNTKAAVGASTTRGVVAAHNSSFGTHSLAEVSGGSAISPKNLCEVVDGSTRDQILSSGRVVYALFQTESSSDNSTMTGSTPSRAQLSFVRINATGDDLEAVPFADIEGRVINYASVERKALDDLNESDFLRGAVLDVASSTTVTLQAAMANQGSTPVDLTTNSIIDLEGPSLSWGIRDDLQANLFRVIEGSATDSSQVSVDSAVDTFNVDAVVNDFAQGLRAATSSQRIDVGVTAGTIESTGSNDLRLFGAGELLLDDGNQTGSTWAQTSGMKLSDTAQEWSDFETAYGEVSLLRALYLAKTNSRGNKVYANVIANVGADVDVGGTSGGTTLDAQLPNFTTGDFITDFDVYLNGTLLRPGATAASNNDYYPGTSQALGQLKFEFALKIGDVLCVVPHSP